MERGKLEGVITNLELADHRITQSIEKIKDEEIKKTLSESVEFIRGSLNELRTFEVKQEIEHFSEVDE
jgi:hypothetical protein